MEIGEIIFNQYKIDKKLGEGGFGAVYQARHLSWNVDLAIKVPKPEIVARTGGVEAFEQEAETWVNLGLHPHTVSCYYVRRLDNNPLVFAEYVAGGSLDDWMKGRKLYEGGQEASLERILDIAIQFAWGLDFAHQQGLIHQDVKPANVMMTPGGVVKVTDFGLAKGRVLLPVDAVTTSKGTVVTEAGAMTPAYCSPEQANKQTLTRRTDLWSWAVSVLEMFVGERTWQSGSIAGYCLENYLQQEPRDSALPQMPAEVAELLSHCFQDNPSERFRTMVDVADQLQDIYQQVTGTPYPRSIARAAEDIADSLNNRAVSLLDLGKQEEAMQLWENALQVQPQHPESTYNQGLLLWRDGEIDDLGLLRRLEEVKNSHPEDWQVDYFIGLVHLERDDCEKAIEVLENIGEEGKGQEEVQRALALAKERLPNSSRLLKTFEGHTREVLSVCLSADGRFALSGSWDNTLKLWQLDTGKCLRTFEGHTREVLSVCLSADGRFALSGSRDKTLKLWKIKKALNFWQLDAGKCLCTFEGHIDIVQSICLSADGYFALSGNSEDDVAFSDIFGHTFKLYTLKLWSLDTGKCLRTFEGHISIISSVSLSADGRLALSGSWDKTLKLWELSTGKCLHTFEGHTSYVESVCLSTDGRLALSGSNDKTLKLWSVETGKCLRTFEGHTSEVRSVCLSGDGRLALSAGNWDKTLKLWSVETGQCLRTFEGHTNQVNSVSLSANGSLALSGSSDKTLKSWSISSWRSPYLAPIILSEVVATEQVILIELTYKRELALAQKAIAQKDYVTAAQHLRGARSQPGHNRRAEALNLWTSLYIHLPRKTLLGVWESKTLEGARDFVNSICLSADGSLALSRSNDDNLKLWSVETGKCLRTFVGHSSSLGVLSVDLSADGNLALSGSYDNTLKLWSAETGKCLRTFEGHTSYVQPVCLSADGRFALSGSNDNTLKLWSIETGSAIRLLGNHGNQSVNSQ